LYLSACTKVDISSRNSFEAKLSSYQIYDGALKNLNPSADYSLYELATELFSDYAEKQRLIKLPVGGQMTKVGDGLPSFPNETMIVKTFYYYNDKRNVSKGKKVIETRILQKTNNEWEMAAYLWNEAQTEAYLIQSGYNKAVNWIDASGEGHVITYHVPTQVECITCHNTNTMTFPIGPKLRNLNFDVTRNSQSINQLQYLQNIGLLDVFNPNLVDSLPKAFASNHSLEERARAYLDINCVSCHRTDSPADDIPEIYFDYNLPFDETRIEANKESIIEEMEKGDMPSVATSVIDEEGLNIIKQYINSL